MSTDTYIEVYDNVSDMSRTITVHIGRKDWMKAKLTKFDEALFDDIQNGEPSKTPLADQLLGLETLMRRIEEAK